MNTAILHDPGANTWLISTMTARTAHTATLLPNGRVLVVGGTTGANALASAELYDSTTKTWSEAGNLNTARFAHTAILLPNGKVLVVGGGHSANVHASAELYDPAINHWSNTVGSLITARYNHTATLLPNGKVLVVGGRDSGNGALFASELYDPASNIWSSASDDVFPDTRYGHTATLLPNGKVLVAGGRNILWLSSTVLYNPSNQTWSAIPNMNAPRSGFTATLLPNGQVLAAGGLKAEGSLSTTDDRYDPMINTWISGSGLSTGRYFHTATLLPNGKVLVAGGYDDSSAPVSYPASAESYDSGLGFVTFRRPTLSAVDSLTAGSGQTLSLTGTLLTGDSEASGGSTSSSANNQPVTQLRRLDNNAEVSVLPAGSSATSFISRPLGLLAAGQYRLTAFSNGIPSVSRLASVLAPALTISPSLLPAGTYNSSYNQTLSGAGGTASYAFSVLSGSLPAGMTLSPGGQLTGTPSETGYFNFTAQAADSTAGIGPFSGQQSYTLLVNALTPGAPTLLKLVPGNSQMRVFFTPPADTGAPLIYTVSCTGTDGSHTGTGGSSPITVTLLTNNVSYSCSVKATNSAATGASSDIMVKVARPTDLTPILMLLLD